MVKFACGALLGLAAVFGCSGHSRTIDGSNDAGEGGTGGAGPLAGRAGSGGKVQGGAGRGGSPQDAGVDAGTGGNVPADAMEEPYVDPGCPDAAAPEGIIECDPFSTPSGCPEGSACKPSISHPYGSGCDQQTFNLFCGAAGDGVQGSECFTGSDCADGFICVVGAGAGKLCLRMCAPDGTAVCPPGYLCGETDAAGIGVCA